MSTKAHDPSGSHVASCAKAHATARPDQGPSATGSPARRRPIEEDAKRGEACDLAETHWRASCTAVLMPWFLRATPFDRRVMARPVHLHRLNRRSNSRLTRRRFVRLRPLRIAPCLAAGRPRMTV